MHAPIDARLASRSDPREEDQREVYSSESQKTYQIAGDFVGYACHDRTHVAIDTSTNATRLTEIDHIYFENN
jgi:hypothetical protein